MFPDFSNGNFCLIIIYLKEMDRMLKKIGISLLALVLVWQGIMPAVVFAGETEYGQLHQDSELTRYSDISLETSGFVTEPMVSSSWAHTVALRNDGTVWAWGQNFSGGLGDGTTTDRHTPVQVQNLNNIVSISAGESNTVALRNDGTVWAWGWNSWGGLGDGTTTNRHTPVQVQNLNNIVSISAGGGHTVALRNDGTVWAWGRNVNGQLGDGTFTERHTPVQVQNLSNIVSISATSERTVALRNDGTVWAWGMIVNGQLGDGPATRSYTPVQVQNLNNIVSISATSVHTVALRNDGTVWEWGMIVNGQLGDGTNAYSRIPVQVQNLNNIVSISAGGERTAALRNDGTVWAWGWNSFGGLGNGTTTDRHIPVQVLGENGIGYLNLGSSIPEYPEYPEDPGNATPPIQQPSAPEGSYIEIHPSHLEQTIFFGQDFRIIGGIVGTDFDMILSPELFGPATRNNEIRVRSNVSGAVELDNVRYGCEFRPDVAHGGLCFVPGTTENRPVDMFSAIITPRQVGTFTVTVYTATGLEAEMTLHVVPDFSNNVPDFEHANLFERISSIYNHDLAIWAAELSELAYRARDIYDSLYRHGFSDIRTFHYGNQPTDTVAHTIAHRRIVVNDVTRSLIVVPIRGSYGSSCSIGSNPWTHHLRLGCTPSVDWFGNWNIGNSVFHEGFNAAMFDVYRNLMDYINYQEQNDIFTGDPIILITGHSRGGAVANLLAQGLTTVGTVFRADNIYVYTFGIPAVVRGSREIDYTRYNNIFNIMNKRDAVTIGVQHMDWRWVGGTRVRNVFGNVLGYRMPGDGILGHCMSEVYLAFLRRHNASSINWTDGRVNQWRHLGIRINTDVDINIYDESEQLVGQFINNVAIDFNGYGIETWVDESDGSKNFILSEGGYTIEFVATDYGIMNYFIREFVIGGDEEFDEMSFQNVNLYPGKQMRSFVGGDYDTNETSLFIIENDEIIGEILEDGTEVLYGGLDNSILVVVSTALLGLAIIGTGVVIVVKKKQK